MLEGRRADAISVTVVLGRATCDRLQRGAEAAAAELRLDPSDLVYGGFLADHIGRSLEDAYEAGGAEFTPGQHADGQTLVAVSLSRPVFDLLQGHVEEDARRAGVSAGGLTDEFLQRRRGARLEAAYVRAVPVAEREVGS